ncbi:30S ribosomal protein S16 [Candidatus Kaiserbacteria bacterium]|nr:30S ribosomal protein S16 [Candidatus Kaiserbacteria bacterium]
MLKIRMQRTGRINSPSYRVVVVEHTASPKAGKFVEKVGTYNPKTKERVLDAERIKYWMSVGAQPSDTIHNMLVSLGVLNAKKINILPKYKEPTKEEVAPTEAVAPAPESPAESTAEVSVEVPAQA